MIEDKKETKTTLKVLGVLYDIHKNNDEYSVVYTKNNVEYCITDISKDRLRNRLTTEIHNLSNIYTYREITYIIKSYNKKYSIGRIKHPVKKFFSGYNKDIVRKRINTFIDYYLLDKTNNKIRRSTYE